VEWVEVSGKTVSVAVEFGLKELGLESADQAIVEVVSEGEKGFLGIGGKDAVVRIKPRPAGRKRRRRKKSGGEGTGAHPGSPARDSGSRDQSSRDQSSRGQGSRGQGSRGQENRGHQPRQQRADQNRSNSRPRRDERRDSTMEQAAPTQEQADVVRDFLTGLVGAFGLEGTVDVSIQDETIVANVNGDQTESMVGPRGSVIEAIHEITKTVILRRTDAGARLRLDIAGHADRRRQALSIYAGQLIDQVVREGGEVVLEPMSAADRKVIHDAVAERSGVRSYSEGESPRRYVVISAVGEPEVVPAPTNEPEPATDSTETGDSTEEE
jgi:spoIIIJ-associated protein